MIADGNNKNSGENKLMIQVLKIETRDKLLKNIVEI